MSAQAFRTALVRSRRTPMLCAVPIGSLARRHYVSGFGLRLVAVGFLGGCAVDYQAKLLEAMLLVYVVDKFEVGERGVVGAAYVDCSVGNAVESECVAHHADWRGVHDDVFVAVAQLFEELVDTFGDKQFGGVGWYRACADQVEIGGSIDRVYDLVDGYVSEARYCVRPKRGATPR